MHLFQFEKFPELLTIFTWPSAEMQGVLDAGCKEEDLVVAGEEVFEEITKTMLTRVQIDHLKSGGLSHCVSVCMSANRLYGNLHPYTYLT